MKKKISRMLGVGLAIAVVASLMVMAAPASGAMMAWYWETDLLTDALQDQHTLVRAAGLDVADLAVDGDTIYAAVFGAATANYTYKSTDGGAGWSTLQNTLVYPTTATHIKLVAVAPDNPDVVAMVTDNNTVFYSSNGGALWNNMGIPASTVTNTIATNIRDIDVSADASGYHYLAAGDSDNAGAAELWTLKLAVAQSWAPRAASGAAANFSAAQNRVVAVKFSPNFATDKIIACVSGNTSGDDAMFQVFRYGGAGAWQWNGAIPFFNNLEWGTIPGIRLCDGGTYSEALVGGLASASIALPSTFLGTEEGERIAFVGLAGTTSGGGVTRLTDAYVKHFSTWSAGREGQIHSVAYHESGKLLAGDYDDSQVYVGLTPMAAAPKFERLNNLKQPGGDSLTVVAWSGDTAIAGTAGNESAFAVSTDDGYAFNDISLIDTAMAAMTDVAVTADGKKVYLTTHDTADASLWVKGSAWSRVLSLTATTNLLVRFAPEDAAAVYVAEPGTQDVWVSKNSGKESWKSVPCEKVGAIQDFAVESADVVYAIDTAGCSKTVNAGASWTLKKSWSNTTGYMVTLAPNNDVLVGGSGGYISYSKDGGASFETTSRTAAGNVHVIADKDYADNNVIYAGVAQLVYRGKAQSAPQVWAGRGPTIDADQDVVGMVRHDGIIYALTSNTTGALLYRALNLTPTVGLGGLALWSSRAAPTAVMAAPQALKISPTAAKGPKLWGIFTAYARLGSINDPIATTAPVLKGPADATTVPINMSTGKSHDISFIFDRYPHKNCTALELQIAADTSFDSPIYTQTFSGIDTNTVTQLLGPTGVATTETVSEDVATVTPAYTTTSNATGANATTWYPAVTTTQTVSSLVTIYRQVNFMPGTTYYWRVRVAETGPMLSPWSATRSFAIDSFIAPFDIVSPTTGATDVPILPNFVWAEFEGAIGYEIMVAEDKTFAIIDWSRTCDTTFYKAEEALAYDTTYYWRVRGVTGPALPQKAAPGGAWVTGMFTTAAKEVPVEPTVIVTEKPAPPAEVKVIEVPTPTPAPPISDALLYAIIAIGAVLLIALIVLIVRTRRVV